MPGFVDSPKVLSNDDERREGFEITAYDLDKDEWTEGFITMGPDD
jgi:hypothetical protein